MKYRALFATRKTQTPQTEGLIGMTENSAGGYAYPVDNWTRLARFLILGSEGGTYYIGERPLTVENALSVKACIEEDGLRVVQTVVEISTDGRAPKNDPALFVLAMAAGLGNEDTRKAALAALPKVARTGTHLLHFADFVEGFRGWGRGLKRAVADWYLKMDSERLSLQLVKYKQRDGWSHRDLLRLAHPKTEEADKRALLGWTVQPENAERVAEAADKFRLIDGMVRIQNTENVKDAVEIIRNFSLPREVVPTELLNEQEIWNALLVDMPMTAMIRNLAKMTSIGLLATGSDAADYIADTIRNPAVIRKARVHPLTLLMAQKTYASGRGLRGSLSWAPVASVIDALDDAFYTSFKNIEPTGARIMLALDVSGSMATPIAGSSLLASEASAAMALVTAATEKHVHIVGFTADENWDAGVHFKGGLPKYNIGRAGLVPLPISAKQRLDDVCKSVSGLTFGPTDCALPMLYAMDKGLKIDAFVIYTDSETWFGQIHPVEALRRYREKAGIAAKLIVVGMTSNGFSIADPNDAGMMDVVGFDSAAPRVIADFMRDSSPSYEEAAE
ncbi:MAG: TROVE domain-containing protein [Alphaproteobacteria bacterium]|nr:TROVE domain-containing protein [Alphaproteobacteria bacterium]MCB9974545.1 TROVE domain-containing protein [Rhodospirillales bacterium]